MKIIQTILLILFSCFQLSNLMANSEILQKAKALYEQKKYAEAAELYSQLTSEGFTSSSLNYNLGNCYFKSSQLGKAILHFERALIENPNDPDIQHNLAYAKEQRIDEIDPLPSFFLSSWWNGLARKASSNIWVILQYLIMYAGAGGIILWMLGKERGIRKRGFVIGIGLIVFSLLPLLLAYHQSSFEKNTKKAILIKKESSLFSAPDEKSNSLLLIHEGTDMELMDAIGQWHKVRLANGEIGWLPFAAVEQI